MKPGDEVFFWSFDDGRNHAKLIVGRIRDMDDAHASIVALASAPRAFVAKVVALKRLKPLADLHPRKNPTWRKP